MKEYLVFKVAYCPPFSRDFVFEVVDYVTPVMVDPNGDGAQYYLEDIEEFIEDGTIKATEEDKELIEELKKEGIEYIEF